MELKFMKKPLHCMKPLLSQIHSQEQTQEIRLPDAYSDIGRVLGCWGQVLIRGKEWRSTFMGANGGIMVWVLYAPEDGTQPRVLDAWIPIQCRWDFQESADDGVILLRPMLKELDCRGISARKIMVRACVDTFAQAMGREIAELSVIPEMPDDIQLLTKSYPAEMPMESGEKQLQLEETLSMPGNLPVIHKLISYEMKPSIKEQKVLGNRLVFRGQADIHIKYMTEEGGLYQWETEIPISQYTELDRDYSTNAQAWIIPVTTALELDLTEDHNLNLRGGIAAQYTIFDRQMVDVVEDAFSPLREVTPKIEQIRLPILLDSMDMEMQAQAQLREETGNVISADVYGSYPSVRMGAEGMEIQMNGQFRVISGDAEGQMIGEMVRFDSAMPISAAEENMVQIWMGNGTKPEVAANGNGHHLHSDYPITVQMYSGSTIPMVSELQVGELREPDPKRPSMIIRRAGEEGLWEIAKASGSTVVAIREANNLSGEPENGQMLLIPVC